MWYKGGEIDAWVAEMDEVAMEKAIGLSFIYY